MSNPKLGSELLARRLRAAYNSLYFAPLVVFLALISLTYGAWQSSRTTLNSDIGSALSDRTNRMQQTIKERLATYEQVMTGGAGLIRSSQDVTKNEWHDYVSTFYATKSHGDIRGIGYIKIFNAEQLPDIQAYMQAQGITDFRIVPDTPRSVYTAVLYNEPADAPRLIGADMFTIPERHDAMVRSRDSAQASITPPVKSLDTTTEQPVMVIFFPQYKSGSVTDTVTNRQRSIEGYTYTIIKAHDFFNGIMAENNADNGMVLRVASQKPSEWSVLYESDQYKQANGAREYTFTAQTMEVYGQTWKLSYGFQNHELVRPQRRIIPLLTLLAGLLFSLLLAEVIYLLLKARAREFSDLKEQAVDLAKDELLSLASHQLRTPATTVKQYLGMVLQGFAGDITTTQQSLLNKAYAGNERQLYIINEMLHIAKIDAGRIVLARHKTDIVKLVRDILFEAQPDIDEANHTVKQTLPTRPLYLQIDEHMLRMAIENLVSNAIKYT
ncbi:MAG TPA: CHASE domain-containing protein, partial [Candidatus Limnocylindrales bacterium]|nr:CHASE domain-containing protein [Candidatus Limnocylindrales bacterium]